MALTYEYHGDEVRAVYNGHVIAHGTDFAKVAMSAEEYFNSLRSKRKMDEHDAARKSATHITTPNGAKGEILNRVAGLWGEQEITVRFENGQIRRFDTLAGDEKLSYTREQPDQPKNIREAMQRSLDEDYDHGIAGLTNRLKMLADIRREAAASASVESNPVELNALHQMVLAAEYEAQEVKEALEHLQSADVEAYMPPSFAAVEQADLGRAKGDTWLDVVARQMISESEAEDYDKLLEEGPTELVSNLDDAAVHDASVVREAASDFIMGRTAGFQGEKVQEYREAFVAKCEQARRQDLMYRQQVQAEATQKEAATTENVSDEALFL